MRAESPLFTPPVPRSGIGGESRAQRAAGRSMEALESAVDLPALAALGLPLLFALTREQEG